MFFDTLAGIVERHLPEYIGMMSKARIFRLEGGGSVATGIDVVSKWHPDERTIENFRLPFDVVSLERAGNRQDAAASCAILKVIDAEKRLFQVLGGMYRAAAISVFAGELVALPKVEQELAEGDKWSDIVRLIRLRMWDGDKKTGLKELPSPLVSLGQHGASIKRVNDDMDPKASTITFEGKTLPLSEVKVDAELMARIRQTLQGDVHAFLAHMSFLECAIAIIGILAINEPASFIVEERPLHEPRETPKTIRRSCDRPHYIVLKPRQIRERFLWPDSEREEKEEEEKRHPTPHERRGHFRKLQSDRYVNAKGQVIWIKPMWVGPQVAVKGGNRYKVRLDL